MKDVTIIHHSDLDGYVAAAIVYDYIGGNPRFIEANYGDRLPKLSGKIFVVDFSFPEMLEYDDLVWIDHHSTALEYADKTKGIFNVNKSAAMNTWEYFYPDLMPPPIVTAANDYDMWIHEGHGEAINKWWRTFRHSPQILFEYLSDDMESEAKLGRQLLEIERKNNEKDCNRLAHIRSFLGYQVAVVNKKVNSKFFESMTPKPDIYMTWVHTKEDKYQVSFYTDNDIDLPSLFGAKGHRTACGLTADFLDFFGCTFAYGVHNDRETTTAKPDTSVSDMSPTPSTTGWLS